MDTAIEIPRQKTVTFWIATKTTPAPLNPEPTNIESLREQQVQRMITTHQREPAARAPWPKPSAESTLLFDRRNAVWLTFSPNYLQAQQRLLFLLDAKDAFATLQQEAYNRKLAPTTEAALWSTFLSLKKAIGRPPTAEDRRALRILEARAEAFPPRQSPPMRDHHISMLRSSYEATHPLEVAMIALSYMLGQRLSDVIQLSPRDLTTLDSKLAITIRRGKVISKIGPYTLWLPLTIFPGNFLAESVHKMTDRQYILSTDNSPSQREEIMGRLISLLQSIDEDLEARSPRRGGLQRLAETNSIDMVLNHSKHTSRSMLYRYLGHGLAAGLESQQMADAIKPLQVFAPLKTQ